MSEASALKIAGLRRLKRWKPDERFDLMCTLGQGSYGKAVLAMERRGPYRGSPWVIKTVRMPEDPKHLDAILREVSIQCKLFHPFTVWCRDFTVTEDSRGPLLHLVLQYCQGGTVQGLVKAMRREQSRVDSRHPAVHLDEGVVLSCVAQMLLALEYLHDANVLHRDIKTENAFVCSDPYAGRITHVMLGDFGISRQLEHASQLASTWVGTPLYMSPEVLEGREYGRPNDVWSVGCVMVEIMAQRCAFHAASLEDLRRRVAALSHEPVPACYSQAAKDLVALMLQRDPASRPTARALLVHPTLIPHTARAFAMALGPGAGAGLASLSETMVDFQRRVADSLGAQLRRLVRAEGGGALAAVLRVMGQAPTAPPAERARDETPAAAAGAERQGVNNNGTGHAATAQTQAQGGDSGKRANGDTSDAPLMASPVSIAAPGNKAAPTTAFPATVAPTAAPATATPASLAISPPAAEPTVPLAPGDAPRQDSSTPKPRQQATEGQLTTGGVSGNCAPPVSVQTPEMGVAGNGGARTRVQMQERAQELTGMQAPTQAQGPIPAQAPAVHPPTRLDAPTQMQAPTQGHALAAVGLPGHTRASRIPAVPPPAPSPGSHATPLTPRAAPHTPATAPAPGGPTPTRAAGSEGRRPLSPNPCAYQAVGAVGAVAAGVALARDRSRADALSADIARHVEGMSRGQGHTPRSSRAGTPAKGHPASARTPRPSSATPSRPSSPSPMAGMPRAGPPSRHPSQVPSPRAPNPAPAIRPLSPPPHARPLSPPPSPRLPSPHRSPLPRQQPAPLHQQPSPYRQPRPGSPLPPSPRGPTHLQPIACPPAPARHWASPSPSRAHVDSPQPSAQLLPSAPLRSPPNNAIWGRSPSPVASRSPSRGLGSVLSHEMVSAVVAPGPARARRASGPAFPHSPGAPYRVPPPAAGARPSSPLYRPSDIPSSPGASRHSSPQPTRTLSVPRLSPPATRNGNPAPGPLRRGTDAVVAQLQLEARRKVRGQLRPGYIASEAVRVI